MEENVSVSTLFTLVQDTSPTSPPPLPTLNWHSKAPALSLFSEVSTNQHPCCLQNTEAQNTLQIWTGAFQFHRCWSYQQSPNLQRSDGARVYLNGIQLHGFPRFSFFASALEKRAPFRLIVKLIQIILSTYPKEELIDRSHPLLIKLPWFQEVLPGKIPSHYVGNPCVWDLVKRNSEAAHECQWQPWSSLPPGYYHNNYKVLTDGSFSSGKIIGRTVSCTWLLGEESHICLYQVTRLNLPFHRLCPDPNHPLSRLCTHATSLQYKLIVQITVIYIYIYIKSANELKCKVIAIFNGQDESAP